MTSLGLAPTRLEHLLKPVDVLIDLARAVYAVEMIPALVSMGETHDDRFWALALAVYAAEQVTKAFSKPIGRTV